MNHFSEIQELNTILLSNQNNLNWENNPDTIAIKLQSTNDIIQSLKTNLNLTHIESHQIVRLQDNVQKSGLAYYFGNRTSQKEDYVILIFGEDKNTLNTFKYYEQFSDCSKRENINNHWEFAIIEPDCNN
jgi:hypothetical protein